MVMFSHINSLFCSMATWGKAVERVVNTDTCVFAWIVTMKPFTVKLLLRVRVFIGMKQISVMEREISDWDRERLLEDALDRYGDYAALKERLYELFGWQLFGH